VISDKTYQNDSIKSRKKQTQNYVLSLNIRGECLNKNDKNIPIQSVGLLILFLKSLK